MFIEIGSLNVPEVIRGVHPDLYHTNQGSYDILSGFGLVLECTRVNRTLLSLQLGIHDIYGGLVVS